MHPRTTICAGRAGCVATIVAGKSSSPSIQIQTAHTCIRGNSEDVAIGRKEGDRIPGIQHRFQRGTTSCRPL